MADVLTAQQRKLNMSRIKSKNTGPEKRIRDLLLGERISGYKLHFNLPGKPDFVFKKYKLAVFIDGCFWHKCPRCFQIPSTRRKFWLNKIDNNTRRDKEVNRELCMLGWKVLRLWEHQIKKNPRRSVERIIKALN